MKSKLIVLLASLLVTTAVPRSVVAYELPGGPPTPSGFSGYDEYSYYYVQIALHFIEEAKDLHVYDALDDAALQLAAQAAYYLDQAIYFDWQAKIHLDYAASLDAFLAAGVYSEADVPVARQQVADLVTNYWNFLAAARDNASAAYQLCPQIRQKVVESTLYLVNILDPTHDAYTAIQHIDAVYNEVLPPALWTFGVREVAWQ